LSDEQQKQLESFAASRSFPHAQVERAMIILKTASGMQNIQIAEELSTSPVYRQECARRAGAASGAG